MAKKHPGGNTSEESSAKGKPKTTCPVSRAEFRNEAKPVSITVQSGNGVPSAVSSVMPKEFSTGSLGWYISDKGVIYVGDTPVRVQMGITITIIGSKELP